MLTFQKGGSSGSENVPLKASLDFSFAARQIVFVHTCVKSHFNVRFLDPNSQQLTPFRNSESSLKQIERFWSHCWQYCLRAEGDGWADLLWSKYLCDDSWIIFEFVVSISEATESPLNL